MTAPAALCGTACPEHPHTCARSPQHYDDHRDVKQKGTETCSWPDPPAPRPAGPSVAATRAAAREALRGLTGGHPTPQWRVVWTDDEYPTDIGPVCEDPDHDPTDSSAYDCCPQPVIEVGDEALAAYLVALLNADGAEAGKDTRGGTQPPAGESTQAAPAQPTGVVQYGIRHGNGEVQPVGGDREFAAGTRARLRATTDPGAALVQRTITPGQWTESVGATPRAHAPSVPGTCARARGTYDWVNGTTPKRDTPCRPYPELNCVASCLDAEAPEGGESRG